MVPSSSLQILQISLLLFSLHHTVVDDDAVVVAVPFPLHSYWDECRTVSLLPSESGAEWDRSGTLLGTPGVHTGHGGRWKAVEGEISFYPHRISEEERSPTEAALAASVACTVPSDRQIHSVHDHTVEGTHHWDSIGIHCEGHGSRTASVGLEMVEDTR